MIVRIIAGLVGAGLLIAFIAPVVMKLKDTALATVVLIGLVMMLLDLWQSVGGKR